MTEREKLIEIIQKSVCGCAEYWAGLIADGLIKSGVKIPVEEQSFTMPKLTFEEGLEFVRARKGGVTAVQTPIPNTETLYNLTVEVVETLERVGTNLRANKYEMLDRLTRLVREEFETRDKELGVTK